MAEQPRTWLHLPSGRYWWERGRRHGRIVLRLYGTTCHEIVVDPPEWHPEDGRGRVGAPYWIQRPREEALAWLTA
jgi:hypothetical protein